MKCSGCEYDITVNDINSVSITNMTVFTLTSGQYMKASNYRTFIKNYLYNQKVLNANEDSIDKLCKSVSVTGYPEDVLSYDIQQKFMYYYQITEPAARMMKLLNLTSRRILDVRLRKNLQQRFKRSRTEP